MNISPPNRVLRQQSVIDLEAFKSATVPEAYLKSFLRAQALVIAEALLARGDLLTVSDGKDGLRYYDFEAAILNAEDYQDMRDELLRLRRGRKP